MPFPPLKTALVIWALAAALYLIGFFHRVAPAVITGELTAEFGLTAAALGNLSALYFYSYVSLQIPIGALADKLGPRRVLSAGALLASAGAFLFALAPSYVLAGLGRFLIGAGVGVAFVSMLKLASHWFHPARFAMLAGFSLMCGVLGAVTAGAPLRMLSDGFGWRPVVGGIGVLTLALALAIWLRVRDDPNEMGWRSYAPAAPAHLAGYSLSGGIALALRARNVPLIFMGIGFS